MAENSTFIKLDRNMKRWRWFTNKNTLIVFLVLLFDANVTDHEFEHETIHRGEAVASLSSLCKTTGLTIREVRTAISHLKSTGEVTSRQCPKFQVFSIVNYDKYQDNRQIERQRKRQASDKGATSERQHYKNIKNGKNEKKEYNPPKSPHRGDTPSGIPERGTDEFRNQSHLLLKPDEGTADDIPVRYREMCNNDFATYWGYRNQ